MNGILNPHNAASFTRTLVHAAYAVKRYPSSQHQVVTAYRRNAYSSLLPVDRTMGTPREVVRTEQAERKELPSYAIS
jgi:hypothetical protein